MRMMVRNSIPKSASRSAPFRATRRHHRSETAEDYTELIDDLVQERGEARTGEIASRLGVSHVTALRTLQRLQREGFVETTARRPIDLTAKGKRTAQYARERHQILVEFLVSLGVSRDTAEIDIEGAEHHMSDETLRAIRAFMRKR